MLLLYRNQGVDLLSKSIDWFLYEWNTYHSWIKILFVIYGHKFVPVVTEIKVKTLRNV